MLLLLIIFCLINNVPGNENNTIKYRLSTNVKPTSYSLNLNPNIENATFSGLISINIFVENFTKTISFHSINLTFNVLQFDQEPFDFDFEPQYELVHIYPKNGGFIAPGAHRIFINFDGILGLQGDTGLFMANFDDEERVLVVSNFQPTHARRVFPCFDEPNLKAHFHIELVTPSRDFIALANMKEIDTFDASYGVIHQFQSTQLIPTSLIAFAITNNYSVAEMVFDYNNGKFPIRTYSRNASYESCKIPLNFSKISLEFFTNYTQIPYPLSKLDFIEYDREESAATENWGLITVRRGIITTNSHRFDKWQIAHVIAHEVAHSWFGNLVTNYWWNDLWLQEAFAVFMGCKAQDRILQQGAQLRFIENDVYEAFRLDVKEDSKSVVSPVNTPEEINKHFNDITYVKGAALLRTVEWLIGEEKLQTAIRNFLKNHSYKAVTTNDFIEEIEKLTPDVAIRDFMEGYLYQTHYPIVSVVEDEDDFVITQKSCTNHSSSNRWTIPLSYITDLEAEKKLWFHKGVDYLRVPKNNASWIKLNYRQTGFYRVNYSPEIWQKLIDNVQFIEKYEIRHLLVESVELFKIDLLSCEVPLKFMKNVANLGKGLPELSILLLYLEIQEYFNNHDLTVANTLVKFLKEMRKKNGGTKKQVLRKTRALASDGASSVVPERIVECSEWVKKNLNGYAPSNQ